MGKITEAAKWTQIVQHLQQAGNDNEQIVSLKIIKKKSTKNKKTLRFQHRDKKPIYKLREREHEHL